MSQAPVAEPDHHVPWWKRAIVTIPLRVGLSLALIVIIFAQMGDIDSDALIPEWNRSTLFWSAAAFGFTTGSFLMASLRWKRVLGALEVEVRLRRLFSHYMSGQFVSNFVPTTVGGDVVRVGRLSRDIEDGPVAFTSVVFERLSGWLVLPIITFAGFAVNPNLTRLGRSTNIPIAVAAATLLGLLLVIVVLGSDRIGTGLADRTGLLRFGTAVHLGIARMKKHPHAAREILVSAFLYQFTLLLAAGCAVEALGIDKVGLTALMAFIPAVLIIQVVPLGIGGLGIREGALVLFLGGIDVPDEQALALGLAIYVLTLLSSLIGLPLLVFGGRRYNSPPPDLVDFED
jgi:glycosyltransferase 2 family protein